MKGGQARDGCDVGERRAGQWPRVNAVDNRPGQRSSLNSGDKRDMLTIELYRHKP